MISAAIQGCIPVRDMGSLMEHSGKSQATVAAAGLICGAAVACAGAVAARLAGCLNLLRSVVVYFATGADGGYISNGAGNVINLQLQ